MIKAALIDLDGFLVNTEEIYFEANKLYLKRFNFIYTKIHHRKQLGRKFDIWFKTVIKTQVPHEEILKERNQIFFEIAKFKLKLVPNAMQFLLFLHSHIKTALVTSSNKVLVNFILQETKINGLFDTIVTGDMVKYGKPNAECYILAAQKLHISPKECVVFEDAPNGIKAGKKAGMKVVAIPSEFAIKDPIIQNADIVVDALDNLDLQKVFNL